MRYFDGIGVRMHSDIAYRLGRVLNEYLKNKKESDIDNYSSTLALSILETILCNFVEHFNGRDYKKEFKSAYGIDLNYKLNNSTENQLGLKSEYVFSTSFSYTSYYNFLKNIRNALSHPFNYSYNINISLNKCIKNKEELLHTGVFTCFDDELYSKDHLIRDYYFVTTFREKDNLGKEFLKSYSIYKMSSNELINLTTNLCDIMSQPVVNEWENFKNTKYKSLFDQRA